MSKSNVVEGVHGTTAEITTAVVTTSATNTTGHAVDPSGFQQVVVVVVVDRCPADVAI